MKKTVILSLALIAFSLTLTAQNKKIAILETVDKKGNVPYGISLQLRSNLTYAISNTPGYEGYDRVDMSSIMGEHDFQRTGMVSDDQIRKLGEMTGCSSILVAEAAVYDKDNIIITAKILNVETASVERAVPPQISSTNPKKMQEACVELADMLLEKDPEIVEIQIPETKAETILLSRRQDVYGKSYYLGEQRLNMEEYIKLVNSCPESKYYYEKGCKQRKIGRILLISSIGGFVVGATIDAIINKINFNDPYFGGKYTEEKVGVGLIIFGATAAPSIPFFISGKKKKANAYKVYNQYCTQPAATLSFGPTANGIGISLNF